MGTFKQLERKSSVDSTRAVSISPRLQTSRSLLPASVPVSEWASSDGQMRPTHGTRLQYSFANIPILPPERENRTGLPDSLKAGIEKFSGLSMNDVRVHYNSSEPAHVQALAYTQGTEIYVGPGQEKHLPHEAWHVVQQRQGRVKPSMQVKSTPVNDEQGLEYEASVMGQKAVHGVSERERGNFPSTSDVSQFATAQWSPATSGHHAQTVLQRHKGSDNLLEPHDAQAHANEEDQAEHRRLQGVLVPAAASQRKRGRDEEDSGESDRNNNNPTNLGDFSMLQQDLIMHILGLIAKVKMIYGTPIAYNPAELAKWSSLNSAFNRLIKGNPRILGYDLKAINKINTDVQLERRVSKSVFGGKYPQLMTPKEMMGLVASARNITELFPQEKYAYISLGNSPVPIMTYMELHGATVLPLPLSGVGIQSLGYWQNTTMQSEMIKYLERFVSSNKLKGKTPVVIDVVASGDSLRVVRYILSQYYRRDVKMLALNKKTIQTLELSPEVPAEQILGLTNHSSHKDEFLDQILAKFYKEGIKYLMWNRTEADFVFQGGRIDPKVQEAYYQRMLIEIARIDLILRDRIDRT